MIGTKRQYSPKTLKLLFGSCGNQCAEPSCTNQIVAAATPHSDAAVIGYICHIYAAADNGPRGKPDLTLKERNALPNLILLCGHHHPIVDEQWETYPAETLIAWKKSHEAKFQKETVESAQQLAVLQRSALLAAHSDELINAEVERIRKGRHITTFPTRDAAQGLAVRLDGGEFAGGSSTTRARALAWCARFLALGETAASARILLEKARTLGAGEEAVIAEAFLLTPNDKDGALALLAPLNSPAARSASLRIVFNNDGKEQTMAWLEKTGLRIEDFDSEGKLNLCTHAREIVSV